MPDTIIEEVRRFRDEYARQFNYDLHAMCEDLRREQQDSSLRVVSLPKRPVQIGGSIEAKKPGDNERTRS
jgi:hypothetical protein